MREDGRLSFNAEVAAGAAGGGIVQPQVGLTWRFNRQFAARLEAGRVKALEGKPTAMSWDSA